MKLLLTAKEKRIFDTLLNFREQSALKTVFRVAGGWVRDKVMGLDSDDIDIAMDDMSGEECARMLQQHIKEREGVMVGFGVIKTNPDKSKHLETATIRIEDTWIDFVNLRNEQYSQDSRIPEVRYGTPLEDARRRDFTINSLFYNLISGEVQDWTQLGLKDIERKVIRTPLDPVQTFEDDPLRILRALRFSARFGFLIEPAVIEAFRIIKIQKALREKVSKERLYKQLSGIIKSNRLEPFFIIHRQGLWTSVFQIPKTCEKAVAAEPRIVEQTAALLEGLSRAEFSGNYKALLMAVCTDLYQQFQVKHEKTKVPLNVYLLKEQLKFPNDQLKQIKSVSDGANLLAKWQSQGGLCVVGPDFLKLLKGLGEEWKEAYTLYRLKGGSTEGFDRFVAEQGLQTFYARKPLLDGKQVMSLTGAKGGSVGVILENVLIRQVMEGIDSKQRMEELLSSNKQQFMKPAGKS